MLVSWCFVEQINLSLTLCNYKCCRSWWGQFHDMIFIIIDWVECSHIDGYVGKDQRDVNGEAEVLSPKNIIDRCLEFMLFELVNRTELHLCYLFISNFINRFSKFTKISSSTGALPSFFIYSISLRKRAIEETTKWLAAIRVYHFS